MMKSRIKLIHIMTVPQSFAFLSGQVAYMKERGFDIEGIASPGERLDEFARREQLPVHAVELPRRITPMRDLVALFQLWLALRARKPAIVHAHTPKGGLLGTLAAWLAGVPIRIYHIRGLPYMTATGYKRFLLMWTEKISCRFAHRVLCVSHSLREIAVSDGICPRNKIEVVGGGSGNGVDATHRFNPDRLGPDTRRSVRSGLGIPEQARVLGFVGRVVRDKGIVELTQAWTVLREEFRGMHLVIVGPLEQQDPIPTTVLAQLQVDPRVHLVGDVPDTSPYYTAIDLAVLPTYREGFPNVPLEAAAMGLPVVATRIPGCVDAVEDGVTGTLVPPCDPNALTVALRRYLEDPDLMNVHGVRGRARVLRDFAQENIWKALHNEYVSLLTARVRTHGNSAEGRVRP